MLKKNISIIRFRFIAALLLFVLTTFLSVFVPTLNAKAASSISIKDQVSSFTILYLMSNEHGSGNVCPISTPLSYSDINSQFISYQVDSGLSSQRFPLPRTNEAGIDISASPKPSGQSFDGTNHSWYCNDFFSHTVTQIWGYKDYLTFLRAAGFNCNDSKGTCTSNDSDQVTFEKLIKSLKDTRPGLFENISDSSWSNFSPNSVIKYYVYSQDFFAPSVSGGNGGGAASLVSPCDALCQGTASSQMAGTDPNPVSPYYYKAYIVNNDASSSVSENVYNSTVKGDDTFPIIFGVPSVNGGIVGMHELANYLDRGNPSLASQAAPAFKNNPTDKPPVPPVTPIGDQNSTCTATDGSCLTTDCEASFSDFGWLLCPAIKHADSAYQWAKSLIFSLLSVSTGSVNSSSGLKDAWTASKNIATAGIILIGIIMVGSQVLSIEIFSAYTVKKILPKLVIATILMQLSWYIFVAMIDIANAVGFGLYQLLIHAFNVTDLSGILGSQPGNPDSRTIVDTLLGGGALVGGATVAASTLIGVFSGGAEGLFVGLIIAMIGALISILITIVTLIIRKVAIVFLIVISPLALLAWILPGTQSIWNQWWKNYIKLLGMFPLITLLFAAGAIGSRIVADNTNTSLYGLDVIMIVVVYFAPLFLIPKTFKFSGTMFAAAAGGVATLGGKIKNGKKLTDIREKNKASKAYNKDRSILKNRTSSSALRRRYGNAQARLGLIGATGAYREKQLGDAETAGEENAYASMNKKMNDKGLSSSARIADARDIAISKKSSAAEKTAAMRYLMETNAIPELHEAQTANAGGVWNNFQAKNYTPLSNLDPTFVGKQWGDLSPEALVSKSGPSLQAFNDWAQQSPANTAAAQNLRQRVESDSTLYKNLTAGHLRLFQNIDDMNNGRPLTHSKI